MHIAALYLNITGFSDQKLVRKPYTVNFHLNSIGYSQSITVVLSDKLENEMN